MTRFAQACGPILTTCWEVKGLYLYQVAACVFRKLCIDNVSDVDAALWQVGNPLTDGQLSAACCAKQADHLV